MYKAIMIYTTITISNKFRNTDGVLHRVCCRDLLCVTERRHRSCECVRRRAASADCFDAARRRRCVAQHGLRANWHAINIASVHTVNGALIKAAFNVL